MKYFIVPLIGVLVSFFLFPVSFTFLPPGLNTKMLIAGLGCAMLGLNAMKMRSFTFSNQLIGSAVIAAIFSFACLLSCQINNTYDYSYASYIVSFFAWLMGAYGLCEVVRMYHGKATISRLTAYMAAVCVFQCVIALVIDSVPTVQQAVDSIFRIDKAFYEDVDRIYGIGAALDPAGVRFSIVLVLIAHVLQTVKKNTLTVSLLWVGFVLIFIIGNMLSRTTTLGVVLALGYLLARSLFSYGHYKVNMKRVYVVFFAFVVIGTLVGAYLYQTNEVAHQHMRFAFEGFFNWVEHGEWRTDSTDKLNREMWVWPTTLHDWVWGRGLFENFIYSTDVGYCRFILYCGLVGFSLFASFFVYNSWGICSLKKTDGYMGLLLMALTFIIWIKVATDIFFVYALFYCVDVEENGKEMLPDEENNLSLQPNMTPKGE